MHNGQEGHGAPFGASNGKAKFMDEFTHDVTAVGTKTSARGKVLSGPPKSDGIQDANQKYPGTIPVVGEGIYRAPK